MNHLLLGSLALAATLLASTAHAASPEEALVRAGYPQINDASPKPFGNYVNGHVVGKLLIVSSAAPQDVNGEFGPKDAWLKGRYGDDLKGDTKGAKVAELACLRSLRFAKAVVGDLSRIKRVVRVSVASLSTPEFRDHAKVADGCSNLMTQIFGPEKGAHARVNLGVSSTPFGVAMEATIEYEIE
jgi:enamine deaminase RidA (YjgF/YER057c/UK114 family)